MRKKFNIIIEVSLEDNDNDNDNSWTLENRLWVLRFTNKFKIEFETSEANPDYMDLKYRTLVPSGTGITVLYWVANEVTN